MHSASSAVLIVGSDATTVALLRRALTDVGLQVVQAASGRNIPAHCEIEPPALVLLDLHQLGLDGVELARQLLDRIPLPLLVLGTAAERPLLMAALDVGANDCLMLPCNPDDIVVRVQTVLRRNKVQTDTPASRRIRCGALMIDTQSLQVWRDNQEISLRAKERALLAVFLTHPGQVLTHQFLLQRVWGEEYRTEANYLHTQINTLRRKLEDQPSQPVYLLTERGVGYRFVLPPTPPEPSDGPPVYAVAYPPTPAILPPPAPARPPTGEDLVGRSAELASAQARVRRDRLAAITGMPGVGKTALAAALAHTVASTPDQIFWHSFYEAQGVDSLIWYLASFLAHHGQDAIWQMLQQAHQGSSAPPPADVLLTYLLQLVANQEFVLCFDDVQFVDADPLLTSFAPRLLDVVRAGKVTLIVTSPRPSGWLPSGSVVELAGLTSQASAELLQRHGVLVPEALLTLLHAQTEGNPQLVLLAGSVLLDTVDPSAILSQLPHAMPIQDFLLTKIDTRLSDAERQVMSAIAVLLGFPATPDAVAAISDQRDLPRLLRALALRSVVIMQNNGPSRAYTQHTMVRAFYYQQLDRRERQRLHRRAAEYYTREQPDLLHATRHRLAAGDALGAIQGLSGRVREMVNQSQIHGLAQLLAELPHDSLDTETTVALELARAELAIWLGDNEAAQSHYTVALAQLAGMSQTPAVREQQARACCGMGALLEHDAPHRALDWFQRGLRGLDGMLPEQEAALFLKLSTVYITLNDYPAARYAAEQSLQRLPSEPSVLRTGALLNLGLIACSEGDSAQGKTTTLSALELSQQLHNEWVVLQCWLHLGAEIEITAGCATTEARRR